MERTEMVDVLDAQGEVIGQSPLVTVHAQKLLHRVAGVLVTNGNGELLVHRRSMAVVDYPGKYAIIACRPVRAGETYVPTAAKILREELRMVSRGITIDLHAVFPYNFRSAEANINFGIFQCQYSEKLDPDPRFIGEHFFASFAEVERLMAEKPFMPSSVEIFKKFRDGVRH